MKKLGVTLIIVGFLLFVGLPYSAIFTQKDPSTGLLISAVVISIIGIILTFIGVSKDRYHEYKEDQKNNDYRKY